MARYTGADCKRCRREKQKLFLKGAKCESAKCPIEIRPYPRVSTGAGAPRTASTCCRSARSRSARASTGCWRSSSAVTTTRPTGSPARPVRTCCASSKRGWTTWSTGLGFAKSRDHARQLVRHGHITVNGRKTDIPSARVVPSDIIEVRESSRNLTPFAVAQAEAGDRTVPAWLEAIPSKLRILVHSLPERQVIDTQVQEQLIVELYSK